MFRSGSSKRQSSATNSPNASDERQQKSIGTSTTKTTVSFGTSTSSKGKTWRRIKSGNGTSNTTKKASKPTAPSPVDGGFVQRVETATPITEEIPAVPQASRLNRNLKSWNRYRLLQLKICTWSNRLFLRRRQNPLWNRQR